MGNDRVSEIERASVCGLTMSDPAGRPGALRWLGRRTLRSARSHRADRALIQIFSRSGRWRARAHSPQTGFHGHHCEWHKAPHRGEAMSSRSLFSHHYQVAAAASLMPEELPAVTVPPFAKAGRNWPTFRG